MPSSDLQAALAKAEQSNDQALIAASSGALGNLAFMSRRTAVAEPLLKRSRDLASRLRDPAIVAASENDLGNLYASTGRPLRGGESLCGRRLPSAEAAHDEALAATAETNAARLALRRKDIGERHGVADAGGRHARAIAALLQPRNGAGLGRLGRVRR